VMLVSLPGCPYCELVRRNYLIPGRRDAGLHAWQITVSDRSEPVAGFDGQPSSGAELARLWKATFTPTVLFFDATGKEVAERLVGAASPDFYGYYLDERIATARGVMKKPMGPI
jgi:thioredoxin-related protein